MICARCGQENPDGFRFCGACGAELAAVAAPEQVRKRVTVLFCDIVGSTGLGERMDPEALRGRLERWFADVRERIEHHGGTVEKFIGDAVMAIFGLPVAHEDDALRALRCAVEIRDRIPEMAAALGLPLQVRIGVNSGEVATSTGATLATGDAVNVAARLQSLAEPGEIVIGAETFGLARSAVRTEPLPPLAVKGRAEPVGAHRLVGLEAGVAPIARRPDARVVGRDRERAQLLSVWEDSVRARSAALVTVLAPAGIGKSRLAADLLERIGEGALVVAGRCLPYGEGITYWPLLEVLQALGAAPADVIGGSPEATQLAFRRLLEGRAAKRPVVVVFDDLQWAEAVFLDLVEHVADSSRGVPILLLCLARPELLEQRPDWAAGKPDATTIRLEPLAADAVDELLDGLLLGRELEAGVRARVLSAAGGNPLYAEEMIAMLQEGNGGPVGVPPTIQALLQARLDQLDPRERAVLQRGAVEGEVFHRGAVARLAPENVRPEVGGRLTALVRKELVRTAPPTVGAEEAYRFRHLLIRDAAYEALGKGTRAELHECLAAWLEEQAGELYEVDEILGYHLEQAVRYRRELGEQDDAFDATAERAARRLRAAAHGAFGRGDDGAAAALLHRAAGVLPPGDERRLLPLGDLVASDLFAGDVEAKRALADEIGALPGPLARAYVQLIDAFFAGWVDAGRMDEVRVHLDGAIATFTATGDDRGLASAAVLESLLNLAHCRGAASLEANTALCDHARRAGLDFLFTRAQSMRLNLLDLGPTPITDCLRQLSEMEARVANDPAVRGALLVMEAFLRSLAGESGARAVLEDGRRALADVGGGVIAYRYVWIEGLIEQALGDHARALALYRECEDILTAHGMIGVRTTVRIDRAALLAHLGHLDEALELAGISQRESAEDDWYNHAFIRALRAERAARDGDPAAVARLVAEAREITARTDFWVVIGGTEEIHARAYGRLGRTADAHDAARRALAAYDGKGDAVDAQRVREQLLR